MTQYYIGCKQIEAWPEEKDGRPGYAVKYPGGYQSWSPRSVFEAAYLPMGHKFIRPGDGLPASYTVANSDTITEQIVRDFIATYDVTTLGEKTTVVRATLVNGFEIVESSSCVDPANYDEEKGAEICRDRIRSRVWHLLGFLLQTARNGVKQ